MSKTYANCWEKSFVRIQRLFLTLLIVAGLTQIASATCTIHGGTIGNAQTSCGPFDPSAITNVTSVSSPYGGPFAYIWLVTTDQNAVNGNNTNWTVIPGATGATYDPGHITQTTWYRRCARRNVSSCPNFDGESNWIKMTVNPVPNATISPNTTITQGQSTTITATGGGTYAWSTGATGASITVSPTATTTYTVTVTGSNGCTVVRSSTVTVNGAPAANCNNIGIVPGNGTITVNGVNGAPVVSIQVFDVNWHTVYNQFFTNSPGSVTVPNLPAGTYYVKVQYLTAAWSEICKKEVTVAVTGGGGGCNNVTSGGTIGSNQTICPGATPATLTSVTAPSGGTGNLEYQWLSSTTGCPTNINQAIPGANGATYSPGALTQTTYFVRCSRRAGCTDWTVGESNCVTITVSNNGCGPVADCNAITFTAGNGSITVSNLSNANGITIIQAYDANWNQVFNQYYTTTPASVTIPSLAGGNYWVKAQYLTTSWSEICKKEMTVTVQGTAPAPTISISDVTVNENAGTASLQICASAASTSPITVVYSTSNGSAIAGSDYTTTSATATIPAGQTCTTVTFPILDDNLQEPTESFNVTLSNPSGATIADGTGTVTILDNDNAPQFDCNTASVVVSGSNIVVSNLANAPIIIIQAADPSWNQIFNQWYTSNPGTVNIPVTASGTYYVKVQYLTSSWSEICKKEVYLQVVGAPTGVLTFPQPGNVTVTAGQGATSAIVNYPTPTATSTCTVGSVNVTRISGPASGSSFPIGTTQVCYRATDGCGNSIDRCFNVIVNAPAGPICNVTRNVTNNMLRNSNCSMANTAYGMWLNVNYPGTTSPYYSFSNATFVENADGTATLTAEATNVQNHNVKFTVSANFCGRTFSAPAGSPKAPCYSYNSNGWYYYTTICGTLTGTNAAAGTVIQITRRGEAFQVGTGANLNENVFGASGWFNAYVTSGSVPGLLDGDFNFNLSGTPTAPACGTGTANCSTVACYTPPAFPNPNLCYRIVNKASGYALDTDYHPWLTQRPVDGTSSQAWKLVSAGGDYYYIKSQSLSYNGQVVDIQNGSTADNALADIVHQTGADCQKFRLQDAGNGFYYLVAKHSGKALKLVNTPGTDGTQIKQLGINSSFEHQKWKFEVVTCSYQAVAQTAAVSLSATKVGKQVNLRWMSNTGTQNASYVVERSTDGVNYAAITTGDGFSTDEVAYYNEVDAQPAKADNYYRVRMILRDGSERVSNEQRVFMPEVGSFGMYPNPANERVTLDVSDFVGQNVTVQLFNQLGKLVQTIEVDATSGLIDLNLSDLTSGFYGVSIESNGVKRSSKLLVTK